MRKLFLLATLFVLFSARAWGANAYIAPNFDINVSTNIAGLTALKGGAPAATDYIWISQSATLTAETSFTCASIYLGDNSGGTATVKAGHAIFNAGITWTIGSAVLLEGLNGEGSLSSWTFNGTSASPITVTDTTVDKYSNYSSALSKITATFTTFEHLYGIYLSNAQNSFDDCTFLDGSVCWINTNTSSPAIPASAKRVTFQGCTGAIQDTTTTTPVNWLSFFAQNEIKLIGNSDGSNYIIFRFGTTSGISRYFYGVFSANPIARHKCLGKNCRLGGL